MKTIYSYHAAEKRWESDLWWLKSRFSFSFANYYNPEMMGFGTLRVINDDIVAWGKGFWKHPHSDMEIISIPTSWALAHSDSMGNNTIIQNGEVQVMSAGSGVVHSEMNHNPFEPAKFFQIWIETREKWIGPHYSQKEFRPEDRHDKLQLLASPQDADATVKIHQDAYISRGNVSEWKSIEYKKYLPNNGIYIFVISWSVEVDGEYNLSERDGLWTEYWKEVIIQAKNESDVLILEVPMS